MRRIGILIAVMLSIAAATNANALTNGKLLLSPNVTCDAVDGTYDIGAPGSGCEANVTLTNCEEMSGVCVCDVVINSQSEACKTIENPQDDSDLVP